MAASGAVAVALIVAATIAGVNSAAADDADEISGTMSVPASLDGEWHLEAWLGEEVVADLPFGTVTLGDMPYTLTGLEPGQSYELRFVSESTFASGWVASATEDVALVESREHAALIPAGSIDVDFRIEFSISTSGELKWMPPDAPPQVGVKYGVHGLMWESNIVPDSQWYRRAGAGVRAIDGETAATLKPTAGLAGAQLRYCATGRMESHQPRTVCTEYSDPVEKGVLQNRSPLSTVGTPKVGEELRVKGGVWVPSAALRSYAWYVGSKRVGLGTAYTLKPADVGRPVWVLEIVRLAGYEQAEARTAGVKVAKGDLVPKVPAVAGWPRLGATLTARPGVWGVKTGDIAFTYRWARNGRAVPGAKGATYRITKADLGAKITVTVRGVAAGYGTAPAEKSKPVTVPR